ncbi:thioesterase [Hymenobacter cavernae]|uniref:Thioesterase n=2 Tax=Hymenobacter cavernae TaxID=2044852 RepID=A0ABQ1TYR8_9BACT|nr:thioesterase [Hymenobacter cavernae]
MASPTIYFLMENNSAPAFRFSRNFTVTDADIDELGHANNVQYVRWVQDTAGAHWLSAYPPGERDAFIWVVLEHRIRYHRPSFAGEELRGTTWIGEIRGAQCQRFVRIERVSDGVLLCEAETQWVLLDPRSQRPKRVEEAVVKRLWGPMG